MVALLVVALITLTPAFAVLSTPRLWLGVAVFQAGTIFAAAAPWRRAVVAALVVVLLYSLWNVAGSAVALARAGGWAPAVGG